MFSASLSLAQLMAQVLSGQFSHMWQKPLSLQMTSLIDIKCLIGTRSFPWHLTMSYFKVVD